MNRSQLPRRSILAGAPLLFGAAGIARAGTSSSAVPDDTGPVVDPNHKFDESGNVLIWPGNTIVSPLPACSDAFAAMLRLNADVTRLFRENVAATPPSSYHMTIFGGVDEERRKNGWWPSDMPLDTPIATMNTAIEARLRGTGFDYSVPIRMVVDTSETLPASPAVYLLPASEEEGRRLYRLRAAISKATGIHAPDVMTFRFHVTFGYLFRKIPVERIASYRAALFRWRRSVQDVAPVIAFPAPSFCTFRDMFAFDPVMTLPSRNRHASLR